LCEAEHCGFGNCTETVNFATVQKAIPGIDINRTPGRCCRLCNTPNICGLYKERNVLNSKPS